DAAAAHRTPSCNCLPDRLTGGSLAIFMLTFFATLLGEVARPHDLCANLAGRDLSLLKTSSARIHWWFRTHGDSLRSWRSRQTERAFEQEAFASAFRALDIICGARTAPEEICRPAR